MEKIYHKSIKSKNLETLQKNRKGAWINIVQPTEEDLLLYEKKYNLELGLLQDATDQFEVPRLEIEDGYIYIFTRVPQKEAGDIVTVPLLIVFTGENIFTISAKKLVVVEHFLKSEDFYTTQKIKFLIQLFFSIHDEYSKFLTIIRRNIKGNKVKLESISNKDIIQLIYYEENLQEFINDLLPTGVVLRTFLTSQMIELYEEDEDLVEDLLLKNNELVNVAQSKLKTIVNIRNAYSTIMTNNLNRVIRVLTGLTVILTVPMIISGLYGMNVALPFAKSPYAFWLIGGMIVFFSLLFYLVFMRKRWF